MAEFHILYKEDPNSPFSQGIPVNAPTIQDAIGWMSRHKPDAQILMIMDKSAMGVLSTVESTNENAAIQADMLHEKAEKAEYEKWKDTVLMPLYKGALQNYGDHYSNERDEFIDYYSYKDQQELIQTLILDHIWQGAKIQKVPSIYAKKFIANLHEL